MDVSNMAWRSKSRQAAVIALFLATILHVGLVKAQTESEAYVGAQACGMCHPAKFAGQNATGHARSLSRAHEHPLAAYFVPKSGLLRSPKYYFQFLLSSDDFKVQAFDEHNVLEIPIEWAFGAGEQAVTFVSRISKDWYLEHSYSYYSRLGSLAPTPGHETLVPKTLPEATGLMYKTLDPKTGILGCFECHSTGPVSVGADGVIQPFEPGVRCESCHGPGRQHVEAAARGQVDRARKLIKNPRRLSASELNQFCGTCHRPPGSEGVRIDWNFPWNVRHQPPYFSQSPCFQQSRGALSCLTCHNPHKPLRKNEPAYYDQKCATCHALTAHPPTEDRPTPELSDCADCHMPRVVPQPPLRFTNHWIGIYQSGAKLTPSP